MIFKNKNETAVFFLRIGITFVFFYAGIATFLNPNDWSGFIPSIGNFITGAILLNIHSVVNIFLGLWLLSNRKIFYACIVSGVVMFFIIAFNIGVFDIVFRDIAILASIIALGILTK